MKGGLERPEGSEGGSHASIWGKDGPGREVASAKALWWEHASWVEEQQEATVAGTSDQGSEDVRSEGCWGYT